MRYFMSKNEKIINLITNKTKQFSITINNDLFDLFKKACEKNNTKPTRLIEIWMIDYLDKHNML